MYLCNHHPDQCYFSLSIKFHHACSQSFPFPLVIHHHRLVLPVLEFHINGIMQYALFYIWLLLHNKMWLCITALGSCCIDPIFWVCHNLFNYPPVDAYLGCFQFGYFMNIGFEHSCRSLLMDKGTVYTWKWNCCPHFQCMFSLSKAVASVDRGRCHTCAGASFVPYYLTELISLNLVTFTWLPYEYDY